MDRLPATVAPSYLDLGKNIWRRALSREVAFLIDADAFFTAFVQAALTARDSLYILGWDTDSQTELPVPANLPKEFLNTEGKLVLGSFLQDLVRTRPHLHVYILTWDFAFIYALERESWPSVRFNQSATDRLRFVMDREHPALASHHQKVVVIDDDLAFSGGLDLTRRRWDTPEHNGTDSRRIDPAGHAYDPFHDVQICVTGDAAHALGDLARARWSAATDELLPAKRTSAKRWPLSANVDLYSVEVGIARTLPNEGVHEVANLFRDSIRQAKKHIYIENQYFTSVDVARALVERLQEIDGPEVVMVLPRDQTGWIEEGTMGLLRHSALKIAIDADRYGRFRCYYPVVPDIGAGYVKIHSKVMVIDDAFVRIGSANLNNRSMGVDTECDIAIEASGREDVAKAVVRLRNTLLAEHLGREVSEVESDLLRTGSLVATVTNFVKAANAHKSSGANEIRTLVPMEPTLPEWVEQIQPPVEWIDPREPHGIRRWFARTLRQHRYSAATLAILIIAVFVYGVGQSLSDITEAWHFLRSVNADQISGWIGEVKNEVWAGPAVILGIVVASLCFVPITATILGLALALPTLWALVLAISGTLAASLAGYAIGRYWAFSKSRILARPIVKRASEKLASGGVWTVFLVRLVPVAPFTIVNMVAGGLRIPLRSFALGTFLGLLPGICGITLLSKAASEVMGRGLAHNWSLAALGLALIVALSLYTRFIKRSGKMNQIKPLILFCLSLAASVNLYAAGTPGLLPKAITGFRTRPEAENFKNVCPTLRIEHREEFTFTPMETRLLCGDPNKDAIGTPWQDVPGNEAAFFLHGFFQTRGYHQPEFILDNDVLFVRPGPLSRLTRFRILDVPAHWDPPKRRLIEGELLTPALLDDLQSWTIGQIKDDGYPCATATVKADPITGESVVRLAPGDLKHIVRVETTGEKGLYESALDRYNAFRVGDLYNERLVKLTQRRTIADGFLQNLSMSTRCELDGAVITRDVLLGPSRLIRVGVGASTELGSRARISIRQTRIGSSASAAEATINASYARTKLNTQTANARFRWYYAPGEARNYIEPKIEFRHEAVEAYDALTSTVRIPHGWNREYPRGQLDVQIGPVYLDQLVGRGDNPGHTTVQYGDLSVAWRNHDHEYFDTSPRDGEQIQFGALMASSNFGANFTAQRFQLQGQKLWSILRYDPPLFVLGLRFNLAAVVSGDPEIRSQIPKDFLTFIGGERDLRGFEPRSLPRDQKGALSGATSSLEGRFHKVIFRRADVFGFVDWGILGDANMALRDPIFVSPGLGLRWESPIGVLRAYGARRFAARERAEEEPYEPAWRLGITYGEEF